MTFTQLIPLFALIVVQIIFVPIFLNAQRNPGLKSLVYKMICATAFVALGVWAKYRTGNDMAYVTFMILGLVFGWLGDFWLHVKKGSKVCFLTGLICFLTGHVFYVIAYVTIAKELGFGVIHWAEAVAVAGMMVVVVLVKHFTKLKLGLMAIPCGLYALVISSMLIKAISVGVQINMLAASVVLILGAVNFVISDGTLVYIMFGGDKYKKNFPLKCVNIVTYFAAQMLLASIILLIK